jgi:hypothetical protein
MKPGGILYMLGALFYFVLGVVYWFWTGEIVGTVGITLTGGLALLTGFYILFTLRRIGPGPDDLDDAEIADADPDFGFFSPGSWWPLPVATAAALIALGLVFAVWLVIIGLGVLFISIYGLMSEYYRGPRLPEA